MAPTLGAHWPASSLAPALNLSLVCGARSTVAYLAPHTEQPGCLLVDPPRQSHICATTPLVTGTWAHRAGVISLATNWPKSPPPPWNPCWLTPLALDVHIGEDQALCFPSIAPPHPQTPALPYTELCRREKEVIVGLAQWSRVHIGVVT
jgi:hypothetical protein